MNIILFFTATVLFPVADLLRKIDQAGLMTELVSNWPTPPSTEIAIAALAIIALLLYLNFIVAKVLERGLNKVKNTIGEETTGVVIMSLFTFLPILWQIFHK